MTLRMFNVLFAYMLCLSMSPTSRPSSPVRRTTFLNNYDIGFCRAYLCIIKSAAFIDKIIIYARGSCHLTDIANV